MDEIVHPSGFSISVYGVAVVLTSAVGWAAAAIIVQALFTPNLCRNRGTIVSWRWKNISVSLLHACLTGTWAVYCFYEKPAMAEDLIATHSACSHTLICVSVGYFIHDALDMLLNHRRRKSLELLLHHVVIVLCFGVAVLTKVYVGYAVVALMVELNSVFLHCRQLLQLLDIPKHNSLYRLNSLVNLATYVTFRIATLAWMTRWIALNKVRLPLAFYTVGSIGLAITTVMNIVLFYRLLHSDFLKKNQTATDRKLTANE